MTLLNNKEIDKCLKKMAKAATELNKQLSILYDHCDEQYGCTPSDIDNDDFIDKCTGSGGRCDGMTSIEFHQSMIESLKIHNAGA